MTQRIHYIANNHLILPILKHYFEARGYEWIEYPITEVPETDFLVLVEPFDIASELYSLSTTWKPWLMEHRPHTRLIVAASARSQHQNCLNLMELPNNLTAWLEKTSPVSAFPLEKVKPEQDEEKPEYVDPWTFSLVKPGNDLNLQLRKFVIGHEESKSLFSQVAAMRKIIKDLTWYHKKSKNDNAGDSNLEILKDQSWENLLKLWKYFHHRWGYYSKVFDYVPYQKAIAKIRCNVELFNKNMENGAESDQYLNTDPLDSMIQTMKKEMMPYIFPEKYW